MSSSNTGMLAVHDYNDLGWTQIINEEIDVGSRTASLALSSDGNVIAVGNAGNGQCIAMGNAGQ